MVVDAELTRSVHAALARYSALTMPALERVVPRDEPRDYLYDLVLDYPRRGGKALRAGLCIATTGALGGHPTEAVNTAASLELAHNAFLIHDDVEDESDTRRGAPTLHTDHGVPLAINAGDATAMLALRPLLDNQHLLGPELANQLLVEFELMTRRTIEGQAVELGWRRYNVVDLEPIDYLRMVWGKTCWYTAVYPMRAGALIAARGDVPPSLFDDFGLCLGALFQITDDIQNLEPTDSAYGKELYGDILEGKRTLPLIHLLHHASPRDRSRLVDFLATPRSERTFADAQAIHHQMVRHGSVDWARGYARGLADDGLDTFDVAHRDSLDNEHRRFIAELLVYLVRRLD